MSLQHLIVRMLHDPRLCAAVYADPDAALRGEGLSPHEQAMLLAVDRRAYEVDGQRAERVLSALVEESIVSALALFADGRSLADLHTFFASPLFHGAIDADRSLAPAFAEHLDGLATTPRAHALIAFERALVLLRRARASTSAGILCAPHVASIALPEGTLAIWHAAKAALGPEPLERLLRAPPPLPELRPSRTEHVLIERAASGEIGASDIDEALHRLLAFAGRPCTHAELVTYLVQSGEVEAEATEIIDDLVDDGLLLA